MKPTKNRQKRRLQQVCGLAFVLFAGCALAVLCRIFWLQWVDGDALRAAGEARISIWTSISSTDSSRTALEAPGLPEEPSHRAPAGARRPAPRGSRPMTPSPNALGRARVFWNDVPDPR